MTRHYGIPPSERISRAYEPVETAGITPLPWGWCLVIWLAGAGLLWAGIVAVIRAVLA